VLAIPFLFGEQHPLYFCSLCPASAIEAVVPNMASTVVSGGTVVWPTAAKTAILLLVVALMLFTWRPWCTLFCPLGAVYSLFNRSSFLLLRFHPDRCGKCETCRSLCEDGRSRPAERLDGSRCVRCLECSRCQAVTIETIFTPASRSDPGR
jgi:ferredoxin-type protein NapH